VRLLRVTPRTGATVAVGLAQIGEFSFILGSLATSLGLLPADAMPALVAGAIVSIGLNPVLFRIAESAVARVPQPLPPIRGEPADADVIIAGPRQVAHRIGERLAAAGASFAWIDPELASPEEAPAHAVQRVQGDPAREDVLLAAGILRARVIVVAGLDLPATIRLCTAARSANPRIDIVAAAGSAAERAWLTEFGTRHVCDVLDGQARELVHAVRAIL
jgi:CPA2 family monovalent cation:H+ antiporter-2